jgi:colanic acid/amylovoran biosynthesis glycosyltransferase
MKLFYFTYCYPYGMGEEWKANELNELVKYFDEITVVPFYYGGNYDNPKTVPEGIKVAVPLFKEAGDSGKTSVYKIIGNKNSPDFIKEFISKKVFLSKGRLISWLGATRHAIALLKHPFIKNILKSGDKQTVLYFYWGKGSAEMLPFINTATFKMIFVRMHRFDLFEYVNNNYMPYRKSLLNKITVAAPSSMAGKEHLLHKYPHVKSKIEVFRCGTVGNGKISEPSSDNILRVVSCSGLSPVKRVHLMIEALQYVDFPIKWIHLGDGHLSRELKELTLQLNVHDRFIFMGMVPTKEVLDFYTNNSVDLFVNTSSSEGLPFSIMEAFAAGIPVMATNVGGTGEIVDGEVGKLLASDITPAGLAENLKAFYNLSREKKSTLRQNALHRYKRDWNAKKLARELGDFLVS